MFAGWTATLLWVPGFGDRYGRFHIYWWGNVVNLVLFTILMLSRSYWLTVITLFFTGCVKSVSISIGFNYCMELLY